MSHHPPPSPSPWAAPPFRPAAPPGRDRFTGPLLVASVLCTGLMAGLFFSYDISVMPGLAELDDRTYAAAMQRFNAVIDGSALFGMVFLAALGLTVASAILAFRKKRLTVAVPLVVAAVCYLVVLVITVTVSLPLNAELAALGSTATAKDLSAVIEDFKSVWVPVNVVRTVLCVLSLGALCSAVLRYGRATAAVPFPPV
ncbi:anthrone oxygenase family protein [Streptomyces sp. P9-A2]|uniref:anthrone oxygenase family protein n=1 Tax=Streptomyces sp. P9-A2 TaxID=3072284 RepID=UPI002FC8D17A